MIPQYPALLWLLWYTRSLSFAILCCGCWYWFLPGWGTKREDRKLGEDRFLRPVPLCVTVWNQFLLLFVFGDLGMEPFVCYSPVTGAATLWLCADLLSYGCFLEFFFSEVFCPFTSIPQLPCQTVPSRPSSEKPLLGLISALFLCAFEVGPSLRRVKLDPGYLFLHCMLVMCFIV